VAEFDLKRLFLKHAKNLQAMLSRKVRDPQLAADLVQDSFLRLAEQQQADRIDNAQAYLYRTAHNLMVDHVRQQQRRKTDLVPHEALEASSRTAPGSTSRRPASSTCAACRRSSRRCPNVPGRCFASIAWRA
jgi:RNA polymerase sigma-70 factor (ECF subfamily)